jgi:CheY-like chemotaxis protein
MQRHKVLIIEDDLQIRTMLERFLTAKGFQVVAAGDGLEGIRLFSGQRPDVVVLDMLLPKLLGTDVCDMIKRSVEGARVPVVMMSAVLKADTLERDLRGKKRPDAFLVKPFQFSEMSRVISALLQGSLPDEVPLEAGEVLEIIDDGESAIALSDAGVPPVAPAEPGTSGPPAAAGTPGPTRPATGAARSTASTPAEKPAPGTRAGDEARAPPAPLRRVVARAVEPEVRAHAGEDEFDSFLRDIRQTFADEVAELRAAEDVSLDESPKALAALEPPLPAAPPPAAEETARAEVDRPAEPEGGLGRLYPKHADPGQRQTTFAELLFLLYQRIFSGVVTLEREGGRKDIYLLNGYPVHVQSSFIGENLGRCLVRMGRISEEEYLRCLQLVEEKQCEPAEALVDLGLVTAHELPPILRMLQRENLLRCFAWDGATYELRRGADLLARVPIFEMNPVAIVAEGLCAQASDAQLAAELEPLMAHYARSTPDFVRYYPQIVDQVPVRDLEGLLDGTRRLADLVERAPEGRSAMLRAMKVLRVLGMVDLLEQPAAAPAVAPEPAPAWPEAEPEAPAAGDPELEEKVLRAYLQMKRQSHFELLGVPMAAAAEEIERAHEERAREFHPDRFHALSSAVRNRAKEIYLAIGQAYEVLRDPARRAAYVESLGQSPAPAPSIAASEQEFRKGERFLQQGRWANAQVSFMQALRLNPREPEYYRQLGWAMYHNYRDAGNEAAVARAVNFIRKAIAMNPHDDRAFYCLGCIHRDKDQIDLARQLFTRALKYNPENTAAREALEQLGR